MADKHGERRKTALEPKRRKAESDRKTFMLRVRLTEEQREKLDEAAKTAGTDMSGWVRVTALAAARKLDKH